MITIQLTPEDLLGVRFAYSPMIELALSYRALRDAKIIYNYRRWADEAQHALFDVEMPYLTALMVGKGYIPDFLTPTPMNPGLTIEDEITRFMELPNEVIQHGLEQLVDHGGESDIVREFLVNPHSVLEIIADELQTYWMRVLNAHWSRMVAILEGDMLYRARQLALFGSRTLFADINPGLSLEGEQIKIPKQDKELELALNGSGLQLVPAIFSGFCHIHWQINEMWHPMLIYGARGVGTWRQTNEDEPTDQSLEMALGTARARVLVSLLTPLNTGEIANSLDISAGAVSQHLDRLNQAGLVEPHRSGKRVYYHLTARGTQLLTLFGYN